jgi:glycine/D-amino acid oxidase-like deaminating enzyme
MSLNVVVVGAGVIGAAIAADLARGGCTVTVLESGQSAAGTSGTTFAWTNAGGKQPRSYFDLNVARSLRRSLTVLVRTEQCDADDAEACGKMASLEGRRTPKRSVASQYSRSERGLDKRLSRVDAQLAYLIEDGGPPRPASPVEHAEVVVQGLIDSAHARLCGDVDEADGIYLAAADLADVPAHRRARPWA